jgi:hypothetical protein
MFVMSIKKTKADKSDGSIRYKLGRIKNFIFYLTKKIERDENH